ncbi:MAG: hypothetical protein DI551_09345 [Micavibrio aeruginosavorus]|uniref:Uncharacterized protein n=1 Tax=Micavibrio aeruginosavorus TaxID=349221 RepID=A0A2W5MUD7_9BACT|nr:MAG: hypothetical protein DI551_09345 [Micavibrio aeruginosavorus]
MDALSEIYNRDLAAKRLILCDVNGTLTLHKNDKLVRDLIDAAKKSGDYDVVIFSNDARNNQETLELLGRQRHKDPAFYGEVLYKSEYAGRKAFMVIDDEPDSHKVDAVHRLHPSQTETLKKLIFWLTDGPALVAQKMKDANPAATIN